MLCTSGFVDDKIGPMVRHVYCNRLVSSAYLKMALTLERGRRSLYMIGLQYPFTSHLKVTWEVRVALAQLQYTTT